MTKLMEKRDWMQALANVGTADGIWCESILADGGVVPLSVPESGMYQVILVKVDDKTASVPDPQKSAHDYIGYSRRHRPEWHTTADVMKELREGETP